MKAPEPVLTSMTSACCLSLRRCTLLNPGDEAAREGPGAHYLVKSRPA